MSEHPSALLQAAESTGKGFLELCQILHSQGVDLSEHSTCITHISLELQKLITTSGTPIGNTSESIVAIPKELITPGVLQLSEPRTTQILKSSYLADLKQALKDGAYRERFPVGTIIPDIWYDVNRILYLMPLIVVDYRLVKTVKYGECLGAILLRKNASPNQASFDVKNQNLFSESSLNKYYNHRKDIMSYGAGCSKNLLSAVADVIIDDTPVEFFPPSLEELHFDPCQNPDLEALAWEYFRDTPTDVLTPCSKRIFLSPEGTAQYCCLRSACRGFANNRVWSVATDGSANHNNAYNTYACAPACVVIAD